MITKNEEIDNYGLSKEFKDKCKEMTKKIRSVILSLDKDKQTVSIVMNMLMIVFASMVCEIIRSSGLNDQSQRIIKEIMIKFETMVTTLSIPEGLRHGD